MLLDRFLAKIEATPDGCWRWTAYVKPNGYADFWANGRNRSGHRVSWEMFRGLIPDGLVIDHLCRNRSCVNPDHLEPVPQAVNVRRGLLAETNRTRFGAVTHCKQGHEFTPENTYRNQHQRVCKTCKANIQKRRRKSVRVPTSDLG